MRLLTIFKCITLAFIMLLKLNQMCECKSFNNPYKKSHHQPCNEHIEPVRLSSGKAKIAIPQTLYEEGAIEISGIIAKNAKEFSVALVHDDNNITPANVPYHFKIFFDKQKAIINKKVDKYWIKETTVLYPSLERGEFTIKIIISEDGYTTFINNEYWRHDEHVPGRRGNSLQIWSGLAKLTNLSLHFPVRD